MEQELVCHFCAYPMLDREQVRCSECGERVDGDEAWNLRREMALVWRHYRWVMIVGGLVVLSAGTLVLTALVSQVWLLIMLVIVFATSFVLGVFIKHHLVQLLVILLVAAMLLFCMSYISEDYTIILNVLTGMLCSGLVMTGVTCGGVLRCLCWCQCQRDLGGDGPG